MKTTYSQEYYKKLYSATEIARLNAIGCHIMVNQSYCNGLPYDYHLEMAIKFAYKYLYLLPENVHTTVLSAVLSHDLIEDARQTYHDVQKVCGTEVAEIVYALTNEKGKTREERANDKYYNEMNLVPYAVFCKLCDRLANATYSKETGSSMLNKYRKEQPHFEEMVYDERYKDMFDELNEILK